MNIKNTLVFFYLKNIKRLTLPRDIIKEAVKRNRGKVVFIDGKKIFTYEEIYERGKRLANSLIRLGIKKGDKVALLMFNCKEYFEIRIATYLSGIVLVPLVPDILADDIVFILNDCAVKVIIYHENLLDYKVKEKTKVKLFIPLGNYYESLVNKGDSGEQNIKLSLDDLASINFSSGTTGRPKGIMLTQKSWVNSFYNYAANSPRAHKGRIKLLHSISLATAGGTAFLPSFFIGAENYFIEKFDEQKVVDLIIENKINTIFITPSWLNLLMNFCMKEQIKLPLKNIVIGTEPISKIKFKQAIEFFGHIIQQGYGMAEVLPPLSLICSKDYIKNDKIIDSRLASVGKPLNGVKIKIVDKKGETGKIAVKSLTVSGGYWNNQELTKKYFMDGWFVSDDFGYIDKQGYLYILGREQDIIDKDKMIFRRDIEEVLHKCQGVLEAFVFLKNNEIYAFVSLKEGVENKSEKDILDFCDNELKETCLKVIKILPELPKNYSGKLDRKKILSLA